MYPGNQTTGTLLCWPIMGIRSPMSIFRYAQLNQEILNINCYHLYNSNIIFTLDEVKHASRTSSYRLNIKFVICIGMTSFIVIHFDFFFLR